VIDARQARAPSVVARLNSLNSPAVPPAIKLYFGSTHVFRMSRLPLVFVGGYPRFQYDGYWVTFVDPWPETWPPTWYETDDV
jgi:hypothetical protein